MGSGLQRGFIPGADIPGVRRTNFPRCHEMDLLVHRVEIHPGEAPGLLIWQTAPDTMEFLFELKL